jgi:hypothetical protein
MSSRIFLALVSLCILCKLPQQEIQMRTVGRVIINKRIIESTKENKMGKDGKKLVLQSVLIKKKQRDGKKINEFKRLSFI